MVAITALPKYKKLTIVVVASVAAVLLVLSFLSTPKPQAKPEKATASVALQSTTAGIVQVGNASISGTISAMTLNGSNLQANSMWISGAISNGGNINTSGGVNGQTFQTNSIWSTNGLTTSGVVTSTTLHSTGDINVDGDAAITGNADISGSALIAGNLVSAGNADIGGNASVSGVFEINGSPADLNESAGSTSASLNVASTLFGTTGARQAATHSNASVDATYGSSDFTDPGAGYGLSGNISGSNLTKTNNYLAGLMGVYNITGTNASLFPKAGVIGMIGDATTTANAAVLAELDGNTGVTTANAAFGVMMLNSNVGSGFAYGLDLHQSAVDSQGHGSYPAVSFSAADIRLANGVAILSGTGAPSSSGASTSNCNIGAGKPNLPLGSLYLNASGGTNTSLYLCTATNTWTAK